MTNPVPEFFIAGVQKAGTTTVAGLLSLAGGLSQRADAESTLLLSGDAIEPVALDPVFRRIRVLARWFPPIEADSQESGR